MRPRNAERYGVPEGGKRRGIVAHLRIVALERPWQPAHGRRARGQVEGEGGVCRLEPAGLAPDESGEPLSHRVVELQGGGGRSLRLLRQRGQHDVVELLHPVAAIDRVPGFGGPRKLDHLGAPARREDRRNIGRQSSTRIELLVDEFRDRHLGRAVIAYLHVLALEVRPGAIVAKADEHLVLVAKQRRGGEVGRAGEHAPLAVGPVGEEEDFRVRHMTLDHPDLEAAVAHAVEHVVTARCGQSPEHAVNLLEGGRLERDDGGDVAHHARVAEHALDAGLGEALEDGVQHLDAR